MIAAAEGRVGPSKSLESAAKDILALEGFMGPILFEARDQLPDQLAKTEARLAEVEAEAKALKEHFDAFHAEADARAQAAAAERYVLQEQLLAARQETEALAKLRLKELEQHHRETVASIEKIDILRQNLDISARSEAELGERLNHAQALAESYSNEIQLIFNSTSWKITGPLRSLVKRLRRA